MSIFVVLRKMCCRLEKLQRDFLWGRGSLENKLHLVSWRKVCKPRVEGGPDIQNLSILNKALLGKWSWRFMSEGEPLWKKVIIGKYGVEERGWCSLEARDSYGIGLWKAIRKGWEAFKSKISYVWGNKRRVKFWKDIWCGDTPLRTSFPSLFAIATSKEA